MLIDHTDHWLRSRKPYRVLLQSGWNRHRFSATKLRVDGRYTHVRRDLGLQELPLHLSSSVPGGSLLPTEHHLSFPKIKRALELIIVEEVPASVGPKADLPFSDDADKAHLRFTEDASWDYSNSKQTILDNFLLSAHRDEEEAAAATLAKSIRAAMQAKSKAKKQKKPKPGVNGKTTPGIKIEQ